MNLQLLSKSRKIVRRGDIFVWKMKCRDFGYGRVVRTDVSMYSTPAHVLLLYFYSATSAIKEQIPTLSRNDLLIPPLLTNRLAWSHGYFETVANEPLVDANVLPVHCFWDIITEKFVDESGKPLSAKSEPCGEVYGLDSFYTIDTALSVALGIEPHPDSVPPDPRPRMSKKRRERGIL